MTCRGRWRTCRDDAGFSLIELLVTLVVAAVLVAAAIPMYAGYTTDARLKEAKTVAGVALRSAQGCAHGKGPGGACDKDEIVRRLGADASGTTADARWEIGVATMGMTVNPASAAVMTGTVTVSGKAGRDTDRLSVAMFASASGVVMRCHRESLTPPASPAQGEAC